MASKVQNMPKVNRPGRPAKYPYEKWLDGKVTRLVQGVDFEVAPRSLQAALNAHAKAHAKKITTVVKVDDGKALVYVQRTDVKAPAKKAAVKRPTKAQREAAKAAAAE